MKTVHELKIWPEYFHHVRNGRMKFQLRRNDRDFKVRDELLLKEWEPEPVKRTPPYSATGYTGHSVLVWVDYIMDDPEFGDLVNIIDQDYVIMSVSLVS